MCQLRHGASPLKKIRRETCTRMRFVDSQDGISVVAGTFSEALGEELKRHSALPYLFLGSGVSQRYLNLPDWPNLLRHFAEEIGDDFDYHFATANGDLPTVATLIAESFHAVWWNDDRYEGQRTKYRSQVKDKEAALKVAVAEYISSVQDLAYGSPGYDDPTLREEVALLRESVIDGVITTNYDSLTDSLFPAFEAYVGQDGLLLSDAQFIAETYKIHGSVSAPASIILTQSDYYQYARRNHYLAAKLLTIFAEHPVIFLGYSLSDEYIREILDNIATAVGPERIGELASRIYFVEWNQDANAVPVIEDSSIMLEGGRLPIRRIDAHGFAPILSALQGLQRPFPAAVLRELSKHVFDLVTHPDPSQAREVVRAIPINAEGAADLRVVFGVGAFSERELQDLSEISGRTLTTRDIERDVLGIRRRGLDAENVLKHGIPDGIRPSATQYLPVHKYLAESGRIGDKGEVDFTDLPPVIRGLAERTISVGAQTKARFDRVVRDTLSTPTEIMASAYTLYFKLDCLICLDPSGYDPEELRLILVSILDDQALNGTDISIFRKVLSHYDRLRFHP